MVASTNGTQTVWVRSRSHTGSPTMMPGKSEPQNPLLVARPEGFEPPTPGSEDQCSNPLSYGRIKLHECTGA